MSGITKETPISKFSSQRKDTNRLIRNKNIKNKTVSPQHCQPTLSNRHPCNQAKERLVLRFDGAKIALFSIPSKFLGKNLSFFLIFCLFSCFLLFTTIIYYHFSFKTINIIEIFYNIIYYVAICQIVMSTSRKLLKILKNDLCAQEKQEKIWKCQNKLLSLHAIFTKIDLRLYQSGLLCEVCQLE